MFSSVMAYNSSIRELNLSGNDIDDEAATALSEG
jgi:Ran GTPase-activating protein (RanGAP) involved in mRNA processing and transport